MYHRIEREGGPGDLRFKLPCRDLGNLRKFGWIPLVGTVVLFVMAYSWGGDLVRELWEDLPRDWREIQIQNLLPALFLIPSLIMIFLGLKLFITAMAILGNRTWTEVRVTRSHLQVKEYFGPWKKKRKFPIPSVTRLAVAKGFGGKSDEADLPEKLSAMVPDDLWSLLVFQDGGEGDLLCVGYPQSVVNDLSHQLSAQLPGVSQVDVYSESEAPAEDEEFQQALRIPEVPAGTKIIRQDLPDAVVFQVPKMGLGKGSHGLFSFGCIFSLFPVGFLAVILFADGGVIDGMILFPLLILGIFLLAGGLMMYSGLSTGTRKVMIAARNGRLRIESTCIFGKKEREWGAGEVKSLKVSPTGTTVGNTALTAMYVEDADGKTSAWLKMLNQREQEWIVACLRQRLVADSRL